MASILKEKKRKKAKGEQKKRAEVQKGEEEHDEDRYVPVFQSVDVFFLAFPGVLCGDLVSDLAPDAFQLSLLLLGEWVV